MLSKLDLRRKKKFSSFLESHVVCFCVSACFVPNKKGKMSMKVFFVIDQNCIPHNNVVPLSLYRLNIINNLALNSGLKFLLRDKSHIFIRSGLYSVSFMMCSHHWIHHSPGSLLCQSVMMRIRIFCIFALILVRFVPYIVCRVIPRCLVNLIFCLCFLCVIHHIWNVFIFPESSSLVLQTDFIHPTRGNCTILTVRLLGLHLSPNAFFAVDCLHIDTVHILCKFIQGCRGWVFTVSSNDQNTLVVSLSGDL